LVDGYGKVWKEGNGKAVGRRAGKDRHRKLASLAKANQQPSETNNLLKVIVLNIHTGMRDLAT
jgi:hypothetical protein